jgi:hypothetical protein
MTEQLIQKYNPDPNSPEVTVSVYQRTGIVGRLKARLFPDKWVEVPSAMAPHLFEPGILRIRGNQRAEYTFGGKIYRARR